MKTSAVRLQYCVLFSGAPLFPRQDEVPVICIILQQPRPGIRRLFNAGPIVLHPVHHCISPHSCFCVLLQSDLLSLPVFVSSCMAEPSGLWGRGGTLETGAGVIGWPYFVCASITSAECSWMQISLPLWEEAHVSEVINFTLECQLWCCCDVFQMELSHHKGVNSGFWQMDYRCLPKCMVHMNVTIPCHSMGFLYFFHYETTQTVNCTNKHLDVSHLLVFLLLLLFLKN